MKPYFQITAFLLVIAVIALAPINAQIPSTDGFRLFSEGGVPSDRLLSNSVIDVKLDSWQPAILMGTGGGLTVYHPPNFFCSFDESFGLGHGSVSALDVQRDTIWAATAYTASTSVGPLPAGSGVGYSIDQGYTWTWYLQPKDSPDLAPPAKPTTTNVQNLTYDLAITNYGVWIASWAGGLRKFNFADNAWHLVVPDSLPFSALDHLNHRAFSVTGDDGVLWVGTAAGINKSTDAGATWQNYNSSTNGLSGDFVTALGMQYWDYNNDAQTDTILWAATWQADDTAETYGVTLTKNGGSTWQVVLTEDDLKFEAHNFAFNGPNVYVATNFGLYKSYWRTDGTLEPWGVIHTSQMVDAQSGYAIADPEVYSVLVYQGTTLIVGTAQGVAISPDLGNTWSIFRTNPPVSDTYAYPNPFYARLYFMTNLRYSMPSAGRVTVKVYDYAMDEVKVIAQDRYRDSGQWEEQWDGRRNDGKPAATGVYYYSVEREGSSTVWGKVAVIY